MLHTYLKISIIFLLISTSISYSQKFIPSGYLRIENSSDLLFFKTRNSIENYIKLKKELSNYASIDFTKFRVPQTKVDSVKGVLHTQIDALVSQAKYGYVGTIAEAKHFSNDSSFCLVNVGKHFKHIRKSIARNPAGRDTTRVTSYHTYYVLGEEINDRKRFDNQEDIALGLITMPFIYKFSDQSFGLFNTLALHLKYKVRASNDKYFSYGGIVGGSIFKNTLANPDSVAKEPEANLLLGAGITYETLKSINVGLMGGYSYGHSPSAWLSVVLGVDILKLLQ